MGALIFKSETRIGRGNRGGIIVVLVVIKGLASTMLCRQT